MHERVGLAPIWLNAGLNGVGPLEESGLHWRLTPGVSERKRKTTGRGSRSVGTHAASKGGANGDHATGDASRAGAGLLATAIGAASR